MLNPKFIRCRNCDAIHHVTAFDKVPNYSVSADGTNETAANDWNDFMIRHAGHRLEPFEASGQSYFPDGRSGDPMAAAYIEVTDGKEIILLRRGRSSIQEPVHFEVVPGRLVYRQSTLDIQEHTLRKEMKLHFPWAPAEPLSDEKIDLFVNLYRQVVSGLDARSVCGREFTMEEDNIAYGPLDDSARNPLLEKCRSFFSVAELKALGRFIDSHRDADDVLGVVVRRGMAVEQRL